MQLTSFLESNLFTWVILPLLIFSARIVDVSIGTLRVIFISRGWKILAPIMGFFEVLIWLLAIGQIMRHLDNPLCYLAYASGFATGNFLGMVIENKLALGTVILRVITKTDAVQLIQTLKSQNHGITTIDAQGSTGPVKLIFMLISRHDLPDVLGTIKTYNPNAFYSVEDVRFVKEGIIPAQNFPLKLFYPFFPRWLKREK